MLKNKFYTIALTVLSLIAIANFSAFAQTKRKTTKRKPSKKVEQVKTETAATEIEANVDVKKNSRPAAENQPIVAEEKPSEAVKINSRRNAANAEENPIYFYEFAKPEFLVSKVLIEHDENGKGKISLKKKDFADLETDPLQLSAATLERLKTVWNALDFLDSTENYQSERDYAHLGTMKFSMKKDGRARSATFNWTENKDAKTLADEYRKIGNQFVWIFDINVARENQPLDAPRMFDALDALMRRNEISDPVQMIPFLKELGDDERIPLIARNHALKLIKKIEKENKE